MKSKLNALIIGLLCLISFSAFITEDDPFTQLLKKLEEFTKKYPQEKIHLHLDKPYYAIGDDIWFNAYVVNTKTGEPTHISNVIYVELINEKDSVSKQLKLPMKGGIAWGDFKLSDSLSEGNYRIRAYTQWMRNAGPAFFFDKTIKIGNSWTNQVNTKTSVQYGSQNQTNTVQFLSKSNTPYINRLVNYIVQFGTKKIVGKATTDNNGEIKIITANNNQSGSILAELTLPDKTLAVKTIPILASSAKTDVQFFPEGGSLVEGLPSKIAVKSVSKNGLGENITATISDNDGLEVLTFQTTYLGMGSFSLTPAEGKTYKAKIKSASGTEQTIDLPKSEKSGYVLGVNNLDTAKMSVKVMLSADLLNKGDLNLVVQHSGNIYFTTKISTAKQVATIAIPKIEAPSGLIQITLFNPQNIPVAERLVFINNNTDKIDLGIQNLKPAYAKRGNVSLDLLANNKSKPVQGSFSIAITNADIVKPDLENESNILTGLLLTSDLVGYVEKPNHYFLKNDIDTRIELDNLLLTQGWRKINWKEIEQAQNLANKYPAEKSLKISGIVTTNGNKPIAKGKIALLSSSRGMFVTTTETDENGRFIFDEMIFGDSLKFVVQASTKEDKKNVKVKLDIVPDQIATINKNTGDIEINVNTSIAKYLSESDRFFDEQMKKGFLTRTTLLKTVTITQQRAKREESASVHSSNLNGRGRADFIVTEKDLLNTYTLSQYFKQGRVLGVGVNEDNVPYSTRDHEQGTMAISLDGMILRDFSLDNIEPNDVESIEVLRGPGFKTVYGVDGANGVLVITMKRGTGRKMSEIYAPGIAIYKPKGYDITRQFYSPKYEAATETNPDLRTTVYWNPQLPTDVTGKASFNFYNTDQTGNYRIVIEGIDADGNLARKIFTYQVK